ncbi:HutD family protein [Arthrobacter sp. Bi83]|uniref:HutD family protein n=1 Tax=Arthrobacter sp. Bi83 TaxID=2822353 RepID=UPI0033B69858
MPPGPTGRLPRIPWRNAAGITREVAVDTAPAGSPCFRWRLNVGGIDHDGAGSACLVHPPHEVLVGSKHAERTSGERAGSSSPLGGPNLDR